MKKAVFFLETMWPIGGSQIMYLNLASYLAEHNYCETYYINYPNAKVELLYSSQKVKLLDVDNCDYKQLEDAYFFVSTNYLTYLLARIHNLKKAHILIYFYHPDVTRWLTNQFLFSNISLRSFWNLLISTDGYAFMDKSNYLSVLKETSNMNFHARYIPVPLSNTQNDFSVTNSICEKDTINIGWLGRLDADKIYSVVNALDNIHEYSGNEDIYFHLIGDGNSKNKINISKYTPKIRIIYKSYMYGIERDRYIVDNCDFVIAMGISALDVAMLGVPVVIPIVSANQIHCDSYIYLFDTQGYSLGGDEQYVEELSLNHYSIKRVISDICIDGKRCELGKKCKKMAEDSFEISQCAQLTSKYLFRTNLTVEKCLSCSSIKKILLPYYVYHFITKKGYGSFHSCARKIKKSQFIKAMKEILNFFRKVRRVLLT